MNSKSLLLSVILIASFSTTSLRAALQDARIEEMSLIPAGEFWMGRIHRWMIEEVGWVTRDRMDDIPAHLVELESFYIDLNEVTNRNYARFVNVTGASAPRHWMGGVPPKGQDDQPVYNVSWHEAVSYCNWAGKRLPSEAEWERAARGVASQQLYPWGDEFFKKSTSGSEATISMAHHNDPDGPVDVASYPENSFGLRDVIGNLWEWTADWYEVHYYSVSPWLNPLGPQSGKYRVLRGASWAERDERIMTVSYRNFTAPSTQAPTIGFRCAKSSVK